MAYRYKVRDDDGDISIMQFDFDFDKGRLVMEPEPKQLLAVSEYGLPTADELVEGFEKFQETEEFDGGDFEEHRTLIVMLNGGWCDDSKKVHEAKTVFEISIKFALSVMAMKSLAKKFGDEDDEHALPHVRVDNTSFLWDAFVYIREQGAALQKDPEKRAEIERQMREETGHYDAELADAMPKALGCWALPVKMYPDQDYIITRVPYEVMEDLYGDWKQRCGSTFDGSALDDELPMDITNELNELFKKFNKKND